jgi:hypothetical protein
MGLYSGPGEIEIYGHPAHAKYDMGRCEVYVYLEDVVDNSCLMLSVSSYFVLIDDFDCDVCDRI